MSAGPGKYGAQCESLLFEVNAAGVIVCVVGGSLGDGFSVAVRDPALLKTLSAALREIADSLDADSSTYRL